jgi:hypothetical protein
MSLIFFGTKTCDHERANQVQALFEMYKAFINKIICYVKDESTNLLTCSQVTKSSCGKLRLGGTLPASNSKKG